jgi:putative phosphoribosyl transferase
VLGLVRGGVPVAFEVAAALGASLDLVIVRKVGVPWQRELAMGAVGEGGVRVTNRDVLERLGPHAPAYTPAEHTALAALESEVAALRGGRAPQRLRGATAVVVDDGLATGVTAEVACMVATARGAVDVVMAAPVGTASAARRLAAVATSVVCLEYPEPFVAVGAAYADFAQVSDEDVLSLLARARPAGPAL